MATEVLAVNTTAANSSDVTIAAGDQLTVSLKDAAGPTVGLAARVDIQLKDDDGEYFTVATLSGGKPSLVIVGAGTYRFSRAAGTSCGVFSA
jgi:cytochrome oxidase Cu insertion factor (SCO1/SenC/PrrC family)